MDRSKLRATKEIVLYQQFMQTQFEEMGTFLFEMDNTLTLKAKEIEDYAKTMIDSSDDDYSRSEYIDNLLEDRYQMDTTFKQLLLNSTFISVFAMFENSLQGICRHSLGTNFKVHKGNIIVKYKGDLEKTFGIKLDFGIWSDILLYKEARNKLVHSSFQLTKRKEGPITAELETFLKGISGVKFTADEMFVIANRRFIERFSKRSHEYLTNVFDIVIPLVQN